MQRKQKVNTNLDYLHFPSQGYPKKIYWKHIVGPELHPIQMYDIIYDDTDWKIRKMKEYL